jgi:hypothetical protein
MAKKNVAKKKAVGAAARRKKKSTKTKTARKKLGGRELIAPRGDKRYVRRDDQGQFSESDDVGRSLSSDRRKKAKRSAKSGQGDSKFR